MHSPRWYRGLRSALSRFSPEQLRRKRLLRGLTLDPDALELPLESPGERDFIICGCPRTGTSLLTAMLTQPPRVFALMEPWDGMRLAPAELFRSLRQELLTQGRMRRTRLDLHRLLEEGEVSWCTEGRPSPPIELDPTFSLGVKWPAYWRLLELLPSTKFLVCVRHPCEVIRSFERIGGRLAEGLDYEIAFNQRMNDELLAATDDPELRRVLMFELIHEGISKALDRPEVLVVRYERWFEDEEALRAEIAEFLGVELGPGPARLRRPEPGKPLSPSQLRWIRTRCRTAGALGYRLD